MKSNFDAGVKMGRDKYRANSGRSAIWVRDALKPRRGIAMKPMKLAKNGALV